MNKTFSDQETIILGQEMGKELPPNSVVCFYGDLGAGKTTFIKGLASAAAQCPSSIVNSPTFVYLNIYQGPKTVYHFDLYRLKDVDEFLSMGFDDYFFAGGICCIEWSERIEPILPANCVKITLIHQGEQTRGVRIEAVA